MPHLADFLEGQRTAHPDAETVDNDLALLIAEALHGLGHQRSRLALDQVGLGIDRAHVDEKVRDRLIPVLAELVVEAHLAQVELQDLVHLGQAAVQPLGDLLPARHL